MSILNVWGGPGSTLVAVDSLIVSADGPESQAASKLHVIPHARSVIAWRGLMGVGLAIAPVTLIAASSFDELEQRMPGWLTEALISLAAKEITAHMGVDFMLSGWSDSRARLATVGWAYTGDDWRPMDELGRRMSLTGEMFARDFDPAPQVASEAARVGQPEAMHQLLRRQVAAWRTHPEREAKRHVFDCGGRGIVAHLQADQTGRTTIAVHDFGSLGG